MQAKSVSMMQYQKLYLMLQTRRSASEIFSVLIIKWEDWVGVQQRHF